MSNHGCDHARRVPLQRYSFKRTTAVCALLTLPGCALSKASACDTPPPFLAKLEAEEHINQDDYGRALPTVVQVLQIKDSVKLAGASFQKLWADPKALLGEDLLQTAEFVVAPGDVVNHWVQRDPKAQYVAAVGLFRQPLGYQWRDFAKLPPVPPSQCEEQPAGDRGDDATPLDTQLRFKLQGYQIAYLKTSGETP